MGRVKEGLEKSSGQLDQPPEIGPEELAAAIRFHRKKSSLSQEQLAKLAGVGKAVVFDVEKGKATVQLNTILKIIKTLNITMQFSSPLMEKYLTRNDEKSASIRKR